jgi:hypothetical protein
MLTPTIQNQLRMSSMDDSCVGQTPEPTSTKKDFLKSFIGFIYNDQAMLSIPDEIGQEMFDILFD